MKADLCYHIWTPCIVIIVKQHHQGVNTFSGRRIQLNHQAHSPEHAVQWVAEGAHRPYITIFLLYWPQCQFGNDLQINHLDKRASSIPLAWHKIICWSCRSWKLVENDQQSMTKELLSSRWEQFVLQLFCFFATLLLWLRTGVCFDNGHAKWAICQV